MVCNCTEAFHFICIPYLSLTNFVSLVKEFKVTKVYGQKQRVPRFWMCRTTLIRNL